MAALVDDLVKGNTGLRQALRRLLGAHALRDDIVGLARGEVRAIRHTDRRDPAVGALVWLRFASGDPTFAFLRGAFPKPFVDGSYGMAVTFGFQTVHSLDGRKERWSTGDNIPLDHLRTIIAGHVVGVLGRDDSAFNWGAL